MPEIGCPITGCDYKTDDVDATTAVVLLTIHATQHAVPAATAPARVEKVKRPTKGTS